MSFLMNHLILQNPILNSENDGILMAQVHKRVCEVGNSELFESCGKQNLGYAKFQFLKIKDCKLNRKSIILLLYIAFYPTHP